MIEKSTTGVLNDCTTHGIFPILDSYHFQQWHFDRFFSERAVLYDNYVIRDVLDSADGTQSMQYLYYHCRGTRCIWIY